MWDEREMVRKRSKRKGRLQNWRRNEGDKKVDDNEWGWEKKGKETGGKIRKVRKGKHENEKDGKVKIREERGEKRKHILGKET